MVNLQPTRDEPIRVIDQAIAVLGMMVATLLVGGGIVAWLTTSSREQASAGEYAPLYNIILVVAFGFGLPTGLASYGVFKGHLAGYVFLGLILLVLAIVVTMFGGFLLMVPLGLVATYFLWRFVDIVKSNYASSTR